MLPNRLVLDIETAPDRAALAACAAPPRAAQGRVWLHRLAALAVLEFHEASACTCSGLKLESVLVAEEDEETGIPNDRDALAWIEARLGTLREGGRVITFNGRRHDLPFLQMRHRRWGHFAPSAFDRYVGKGAADHLDMMEVLSAGGLRWPKLDEACAALGIPHRTHDFAASPVPAPIRKCETDVLATFLLYLVDQAARQGSPRCLVEGWCALSRWCLAQPGAPHLRQFATAETARAIRRDGQVFPAR